MVNKRGLAYKLNRLLLSVVFVVLASILTYNYIISRNHALRDAQKDVRTLTDLTVAQIENVMQNVERIPESLSSVIKHKDTVRFIGTRLVIEDVLLNNPFVYGASVAFAPQVKAQDTLYFAPYLYFDNDTLIFKDLAQDEDYNYTARPWYTEAQGRGKGVWSEPYFDKGGGNVLMATYAVPFYRDHGQGLEFSGVVTADLSLRGMQNLINEIKFFDSGRGFMISSKGNILTWPEIDSTEDKFVYNIFDEVKAPGLLQVIRKMTKGENGIISLRDVGAETNRDQWISYASIPSANWSLGILFKESELYEGIHILYLKLIAIGIAGFIILSFFIFYISRRFVKPIEKLAVATRRIGAGDLDVVIPSYGSEDEVAQLGKSFRLMQEQLKDYIRNLKETTAQKERMESELEIASKIQQQMLPADESRPGLEGIDYYGILKPARQVGGDFYDILLNGNHLYVTIGDVSGKGIPAALFMAKTLTLFRAKAAKGLEPKDIAAEINGDLEQYNSQSMFVTCFIARMDLDSGLTLYTNAGHNPPYMIEPGKEVYELKGVHGIPLGSLPDMEYEQDKLVMNSERMIVLYTDGISEAVNTQNLLFGESRVRQALSNNTQSSPENLADHILSKVEEFSEGAEQADDITLFILKYK